MLEPARKHILPGHRARIALLWCLICAFGVLLPLNTAFADAGHTLFVKLDDVSGSQISYHIVSDQSGAPALAVAAAYREGRLVDCSQSQCSIIAGEQPGSATFSVPYDKVKLFLLDAETYQPLCAPGKECSVQFIDHDGAVLSEQTVLSGHAAVRPAQPSREGYIFLGWQPDYSLIIDDAAIQAQYAAIDAPNIFLLDCVSGAPGESVTVKLRLDGTVRLCAFDMCLRYDGEALEFTAVNAELNLDVLANHVAADNAIYFNFSSRDDRSRPGNVLEATFRIKDSFHGSTLLQLEPNKIVCLDSQNSQNMLPAAYTLTEGVIMVP